MIPAAELASLQATVEGALATIVTVFRKARADDDAGGSVDSYAAVHTYQCSFARYPVRPVERERDPFLRSLSVWTFLFSLDADIEDTDKLVTGRFAVATDIGAASGRTFEVVDAAVGSTDVERRVLCQEIT